MYTNAHFRLANLLKEARVHVSAELCWRYLKTEHTSHVWQANKAFIILHTFSHVKFKSHFLTND